MFTAVLFIFSPLTFLFPVENPKPLLYSSTTISYKYTEISNVKAHFYRFSYTLDQNPPHF